MLGRLARWLRLLGFDTLYSTDITDRELLRIARQEGRTILTRDTHFVGGCASNIAGGRASCIFIKSDDVFEQMKEVLSAIGPGVPDVMRCLKCNGILEPVTDKAGVEGSVPEYVYRNFNRFSRCALCGNIYWEGSHFRDFRERLRKALG
jgi:uncharacterized protein with PIN domain